MEYPSVVKIYATTQAPDHNSPWQSRAPSQGTGSGVAITGKRVLTGAHVVADATFVQVQRYASPDKVTAEVVATCHDSDLALLTVDDESFWDEVVSAEIGELPELRDRVSVAGYPVGGEEVSITEGVVSRIEAQEYSHSQRHLLAITVDAAINEGNSGGPVFKNGTVAGLAFQVLNDAENIGEVVPAPLIQRFLDGVERGLDPRIPGLGIRTQKLENPALRAQLGLGADDTGVLVNEIAFGNSAWGRLEAGDVLTKLDGHSVANNGTITYRGTHRTEYMVLMGDHHLDEEIEVEVIRGGARMTVPVTLKPYEMLVPLSQYGVEPSYYIYGGLVFQRLNRDFLTCWDDWWDRAPKEFLYLFYFGLPSEERQEIVVLTRTLPHQVNVGYEDYFSTAVTAVNGARPATMKAFVQMLEAADDVVEIEVSSGTKIVLNAAEARASNPEIIERYRISAASSADLDLDD